MKAKSEFEKQNQQLHRELQDSKEDARKL